MLKVLKLGVIGSLRCVEVLNLMVIGNLRSLKCVKPNCKGVWKVLVVEFKKWKVLQLTS